MVIFCLRILVKELQDVTELLLRKKLETFMALFTAVHTPHSITNNTTSRCIGYSLAVTFKRHLLKMDKTLYPPQLDRHTKVNPLKCASLGHEHKLILLGKRNIHW